MSSQFPRPPFPGQQQSQSDSPSPQLLAYATTKGAIQNFTGGLSLLLAERCIRINCVAPGPIWTPVIPSTMSRDKVKSVGNQVPMKRPGQPKELAPVCVMLSTDEASYVWRDRRGDRWGEADLVKAALHAA